MSQGLDDTHSHNQNESESFLDLAARAMFVAI
jgi:hypothetical protein